MTLFIVFLATINIAIGYALAVYLGHGQLPWRLNRPIQQPPAASLPAAMPVPVEESPIEENVEPEELATANEEASEADELPSDRQPVEEETRSKAEEKTETIEEPEKTPSVDEVETTVDEVAVESAAPEEEAPVEQKIDEPAAEVAEVEPDAAPVAMSEASESESDESSETSSDIEEQEHSAVVASVDSGDEQVDADGKLDEKFLEGLAAFQNQLKQGEEESAEKVEAVAKVAQEKAGVVEKEVVETEIEAQEESSISDEVLAGIESFRAQLANMQQKPEDETETSESESAEQPVGN